jgi:DNA polymerase-3 subunit beta
VPAHTLYEIVRKLSDGAEVRLETDGGENMVLTSGRSRFQPGVPQSPDSFPDLKSGTFTHEFRHRRRRRLRELIERTQFAISNEETRYYLNGIYFHTARGQQCRHPVRCVRSPPMATAWPAPRSDAPAGAKGMPGIIVPKKTVSRSAEAARRRRRRRRRSSSRDTKIRVTARFSVVLLSKLIEGTFPDYDRVTPKNNDKQMNVDRADLRHRRRPRLHHRLRARRQGRQAVQAKEGQLELSVTNPDHGTASEELAVEFEPDGFEIGFNARYLLDIIGQIRSDSAVFLFNDAGSPTLVQATTAMRKRALRADADARVRAALHTPNWRVTLGLDPRALHLANVSKCNALGSSPRVTSGSLAKWRDTASLTRHLSRLRLTALPQLCRPRRLISTERHLSCSPAPTAPARPTCSKRCRCSRPAGDCAARAFEDVAGAWQSDTGSGPSPPRSRPMQGPADIGTGAGGPEGGRRVRINGANARTIEEP